MDVAALRLALRYTTPRDSKTQRQRQLKVVRLLLKHGGGRPHLKNCTARVVELLLDRGADINASRQHGAGDLHRSR